MITVEEARAKLKGMGEFSYVTTNTLDLAAVKLHFVKYEPGARNGKFHYYDSITLPRAVYDQIKQDLK